MKATIINFYYKLIGKKKGYCCKDCLTNLHAVLDGEATNEQENYLQTHIDECKHCYELYEIDKSVKDLVKYKVSKKEVPSSLIDSIKNKINQP